jgi:hypothetical protein
MNVKLIQWASVLGCAALLHNVTASADDNDLRFSLSAGVDITSGTYGGDVDIEDTYIPLTAAIDYGRITYRLTVPYLSVSAPEGTIFDPGGEPLPGTGALITESGLGDVIGSVTIYDVISNQRLGLAMDLSGKIKFGTADENKGLGTGQNDFSVQADMFKFLDKLTFLASLGYKIRGEATDIDLNNVLMASAGVTYKSTPDMNVGLFYDFRESAIDGSESIQELTAFVSRRINSDWRWQVYALTGFSDSSADWGGGIRIRRILNQ